MIVHGKGPGDLNYGTMIPFLRIDAKVNEYDNDRAICLQRILCKIMNVLILKRKCSVLNK